MTDSPSRADSRLLSAARLFYLLGLLKLFGLATALRAIGSRPPGAPAWQGGVVAGWYVMAMIICVVLARELPKRTRWVFPIALFFALFHVVGLALIGWLRETAILNGALGAVIAVTLIVAKGLEGVENEEVAGR